MLKLLSALILGVPLLLGFSPQFFPSDALNMAQAEDEMLDAEGMMDEAPAEDEMMDEAPADYEMMDEDPAEDEMMDEDPAEDEMME